MGRDGAAVGISVNIVAEGFRRNGWTVKEHDGVVDATKGRRRSMRASSCGAAHRGGEPAG